MSEADEAAIILKKRGHNPILCEATDTLGGQFLTAGEAPRKAEMKAAVLSMAEKAKRLGVDIRMNTKVTPEMIAEIKPHTFINAIGAAPIVPPIPGNDKAFVVDSHAVLDGEAKAEGNVVVIGGGMVGMEVAEYLSEKGAKVTVLEMMKEFCADMGSTRKICVTEQIYQDGITPVTEVKVTEIQNGKVIGEKDGEKVEFPCDYAVMAVGARKRDGSALEKMCNDLEIGYYEIGDAGMARRALNAVREAFDAALNFDKEEEHKYVSKPKKVVFITGATGTMGQETMKQLLSRNNRFKTRILARPSEKNRQLLKKYMCPSLEVVWGDMADYDTIKKCVDGADYVLHIGAMVSPAADKYPEKTLYTNIGSTLNIIKAIKEQPDPDKVHFAYVGTVAMTGSRLDPVQFGRIGDPMNPSIHDYYAVSKVFSEAAVFESGLKYWVSIRQTGQHPSAEGAGEEPIVFHQPANNVLEWSTAIDSGICMANLCEDWGAVKNEMERMMANPMIAAMMPTAEAMHAHNKEIAAKKTGTVWMEENMEMDWIKAFFGSLEEKQNAKPFELYHPAEEPERPLDHGYDEEKGIENLDVNDLEKAAQFRGGSYEEDHAGDIYTLVEWKCASGHKFKMSVNAVLHGGHWCPECMKNSWAYPKMAKENPFYAQVWNPQHSPEEDYEIPMQFSAYDIKKELEEKLGL